MTNDRQTIKYIGFYSPGCLLVENRGNCLAASNKMDYICSALVKAGFDVNIVSPSWSENNSGLYSGKTIQLDENVTGTFCPTFGARNKIARGLRILFSWLWLFFWMLINVKRNEKVIAYHSLWIAAPLSWLMRVKRVKLVLEVEEIYCKVKPYHPYTIRLEQSIIGLADSYIFPNDIMPATVNVHSRPFAVVYGTYEKQKKLAEPAEDGKIHLVYAGVIDKFKAGALNAVESARYLSDDYVMHIIGFGDIKLLQKTIDENRNASDCLVVFDGKKSGDDYVAYMQKCHIGLSTQTSNGAYLDYSFPSKILSYLSLGLRVVSADIECVTKSKIGDMIAYYKEDTPVAIAEAIKSVVIDTDYQAVKRLEELDASFISDIKCILDA